MSNHGKCQRDSIWTEEIDDELRALATTGRSYSAIAAEVSSKFGIHITKNAVIGHCGRRGIVVERTGKLATCRNQTNTPWAKEVIESLESLVLSGRSSAKIAQALSEQFKMKFTRNSVIGMCSRQKLTLAYTERQNLRKNETQIQRYLMAEKHSGNCLWPTGDKPVLFKCCKESVSGYPYCEEHCKRAYTRRRKVAA